jgi:hypothetical protein
MATALKEVTAQTSHLTDPANLRALDVQAKMMMISVPFSTKTGKAILRNEDFLVLLATKILNAITAAEALRAMIAHGLKNAPQSLMMGMRNPGVGLLQSLRAMMTGVLISMTSRHANQMIMTAGVRRRSRVAVFQIIKRAVASAGGRMISEGMNVPHAEAAIMKGAETTTSLVVPMRNAVFQIIKRAMASADGRMILEVMNVPHAEVVITMAV